MSESDCSDFLEITDVVLCIRWPAGQRCGIRDWCDEGYVEGVLADGTQEAWSVDEVCSLRLRLAWVCADVGFLRHLIGWTDIEGIGRP